MDPVIEMAPKMLNSTNYPNPDITDFLTNGKETLICSDFEGTMPLKQIEIFEEVFKSDKQIIYLGDIFDNTGSCKKINNKNYCSLKTLKYLVDYPEKSRYVVGNRDINKIKLVPLLQFKSDEKWWLTNKKSWAINKSNAGTGRWSDLLPVYTEIVSNLINANTQNNNIWKVETMKDYVPFWANLAAGKQATLQKEWFNDGNNIKPMTTLHNRFERIFGTDTGKGTMSADNTLTGIPNELFPNNIDILIKNIKLKLINKLTDDNEIRSAIVFTLFMRMLDQELYTEKSKTSGFSLNNTKDTDGYLWKYLTNSSPALYAKTVKELFLFSHGGITKEFVNTDGLEILSKLDKQKWDLVLSRPETTTFDNTYIDNNPISTDITLRIESYNQKYFDILKQCFANFNSLENLFNSEMMILLSISAPAENNFNMFTTTDYKTSNFSPIQPKLPANSVLTTQSDIDNDIKIFNFCGHASSGYSYGFKKVSDNMYFINTDFTGSLYKFVCNNYNQNFIILNLKYENDSFSLKLEGNILLQTKEGDKEIPQFIVNGEDKSIELLNIENQFIVKYETYIPILDFFKYTTRKLDNTKTDELYFYNGQVTYINNPYNQFSYYSFPEKKYKLILNSTLPESIPANPAVSNTTSTNPYNKLVFGGYRKKRSIHKSKKNKMTKNKLHKKSRKNNSKKMKKSKKY